MKTYNEIKKEVDEMPKGEKKTACKKLLKVIRDNELLQKKYDALKNELAEEERKRLDEFFK
jgi:tRNA(Arg) A34 adenosine deaminase TadA